MFTDGGAVTFVAHQDAAKKSIDALINADEQKPQFNKKKSMKDITSKAVHYVKDEQQTTKYLEHWGANTEVRDMVVELLRTAKAKDKTVRLLLSQYGYFPSYVQLARR
eukprot:SAG31_NODE_14410_length_808_cov_0.874471_2_plen_108_part_00